MSPVQLGVVAPSSPSALEQLRTAMGMALIRVGFALCGSSDFVCMTSPVRIDGIVSSETVE